MINPALLLPRDELAAFCRRWQITELALFGSALRDDFGPESDVDLLVSFAPDAHHSLFDLAAMEEELEQLLGRKVDLVSRRGVERSPNWIRRKAILGSAEPVYVVTDTR
jgi:predicted nucleotidyltransferase